MKIHQITILLLISIISLFACTNNQQESDKNEDKTNSVDSVIKVNEETQEETIIEKPKKVSVEIRYKSEIDTSEQFKNLIEAIDDSDFEKVSSLIEQGVNINARDTLGLTPLMYVDYDLDIIKLLIENGADVNAVSYEGITFLSMILDKIYMHGLIYRNRGEIAKYLLECGAKELDYVSYTTSGHNPEYDSISNDVKNIKSMYKEFHKNKSKYTKKAFIKYYENDYKVKYEAYYDNSNKLRRFYSYVYVDENRLEAGSNYDHEYHSYYYFDESGNLYFAFVKYYEDSEGWGEPKVGENRFYLRDNKTLLAVNKNRQLWKNLIEENEQFNFNKIANRKDDNYMEDIDIKSEELIQEFEREYNSVKNNLY